MISVIAVRHKRKRLQRSTSGTSLKPSARPSNTCGSIIGAEQRESARHTTAGQGRHGATCWLFVHDDAYFMQPGWGTVLNGKFSGDRTLGMLGVAGTQYLCRDRMSWTAAGMPFMKGRVVHDIASSGEFFMSAFSTEPGDSEVVAVDGLFFAIRRDLFGRIRFDEENFDGYHFYDLDICMQVRRTHCIAVTWDILIKHCSEGNPDDAWRRYGRKFLEKYRDELPASCSDGGEPDFTKERVPGLKYDLRSKAGREIIC